MKNTRIILLVVFFAISLCGTLIAVTYHDLTGQSKNGDIVLSWYTIDETNLESMIVERKPANGSFSPIGTLGPKGNNSYYTFTDKSAYKTTSNAYIYHVKFVDNNKYESYSNDITVTHYSVSGVKSTWGSIKAMFR